MRRNPRTPLGQVIIDSGLAVPEALSRGLVETVSGYLRGDGIGLRFDSKSGEPWVLAKDADRALDRLSQLRQVIACLLAPGSVDTGWLGNCPTGAAIRRNPAFVGVHLTDDEAEIDGFDYDDYLDEDDGEDDDQ